MIDPTKAILDWEQADQIMQDQRAEIERLRLTDAEREAIAFLLRHAAVAADGWAFADSADYRRHHDAVFGLLARTQDGGNRQ